MVLALAGGAGNVQVAGVGGPGPHPLAVGFGSDSGALEALEPFLELDDAGVQTPQFISAVLVPSILSPSVQLGAQSGHQPDVSLHGLEPP